MMLTVSQLLGLEPISGNWFQRIVKRYKKAYAYTPRHYKEVLVG